MIRAQTLAKGRVCMLAFSVLMLRPIYVQAKSIWIDAVGIDEKYPANNVDNFYYGASAFAQYCAISSQKPLCEGYINVDPTVASKSLSLGPHGTYVSSGIVPNVPNVIGSPTSAGLSLAIANALKNARSGDTVIVSLTDHGAPVPGKSASCIWLSHEDYFCESDLKALLEKKPTGVKVFINASGCFTGAFADLSAPDVCVATTADRLDFGNAAPPGLWATVLNLHAQRPSDLAVPIYKQSVVQQFLGSQLILSQLCEGARRNLGPKSAISNIDFYANTAPLFPSKKECGTWEPGPQDLQTLAQTVFQILDKESSSSSSCDRMKLPASVCAAKQRLASGGPELKKLLQQIEQLQSQEQDLKTKLGRIISQQPNAKELITEFGKLSPGDYKEIEDSEDLGLSPDWTKFSASTLPIAQKYWSLVGLRSAVDAGENAETQAEDLVAQITAKGYLDELLTLQSCFFENQPLIPRSLQKPFGKELTYYRSLEAKFPQRQFTDKDYEDAKRCENSIHF